MLFMQPFSTYIWYVINEENYIIYCVLINQAYGGTNWGNLGYQGKYCLSYPFFLKV